MSTDLKEEPSDEPDQVGKVIRLDSSNSHKKVPSCTNAENLLDSVSKYDKLKAKLGRKPTSTEFLGDQYVDWSDNLVVQQKLSKLNGLIGKPQGLSSKVGGYIFASIVIGGVYLGYNHIQDMQKNIDLSASNPSQLDEVVAKEIVSIPPMPSKQHFIDKLSKSTPGLNIAPANTKIPDTSSIISTPALADILIKDSKAKTYTFNITDVKTYSQIYQDLLNEMGAASEEFTQLDFIKGILASGKIEYRTWDEAKGHKQLVYSTNEGINAILRQRFYFNETFFYPESVKENLKLKGFGVTPVTQENQYSKMAYQLVNGYEGVCPANGEPFEGCSIEEFLIHPNNVGYSMRTPIKNAILQVVVKK